MARKGKQSYKFWMIVKECDSIRTAQTMKGDTPNFTKVIGFQPSVVFGTKERAEEIAQLQCRKYGETFYVLEAVSSAEIEQPPIAIYDL